MVEPEEPVIEPVEQKKWPTKPKEQLAAIQAVLRTTSGEWTVNGLVYWSGVEGVKVA